MKFAGLWALGVLLCCAGCSDGNGSVNTAVVGQNTIIGRWAADSIQGPGENAKHCPTSITIGNETFACGLIDTQIFRLDGSYDEVTGGQRGTWTASGNTLTINVTGQPARTYTFSVQNDVLTEIQSSGSGPVIFTFRR